ncbi:hypothetical protein G6F57_020197 [Rhizopus arrhizus]|nr:hypothetical protein G6F57_020197 [Rhizopus arrhizus]
MLPWNRPAGAHQGQPLARFQQYIQILQHIVRCAQRTQHQPLRAQRRQGGLGRLHRQRGALVVEEQALFVGQRLQQALHFGGRRQGVGTVVVVRGQPPQWCVELRGQQQAEQAGAQRRHRCMQRHHAQVAQAEVQRNHRHAHRGEEFQHRG